MLYFRKCFTASLAPFERQNDQQRHFGQSEYSESHQKPDEVQLRRNSGPHDSENSGQITWFRVRELVPFRAAEKCRKRSSGPPFPPPRRLLTTSMNTSRNGSWAFRPMLPPKKKVIKGASAGDVCPRGGLRFHLQCQDFLRRITQTARLT